MVRTLIIDDNHIVLEALSKLLLRFPGVSVAGMASNGKDGLLAAENLVPDLVLVDLKMPDMNGLEVASILRQKHPAMRVVIISMHDDDEYRARAAAIGVERFVCKNDLLSGLLHIFRQLPSAAKPTGML